MFQQKTPKDIFLLNLTICFIFYTFYYVRKNIETKCIYSWSNKINIFHTSSIQSISYSQLKKKKTTFKYEFLKQKWTGLAFFKMSSWEQNVESMVNVFLCWKNYFFFCKRDKFRCFQLSYHGLCLEIQRRNIHLKINNSALKLL